MKLKPLREFIKENRQHIDDVVRARVKDPKKMLTDEERRLWVVNDEALYLWARKEGVDL